MLLCVGVVVPIRESHWKNLVPKLSCYLSSLTNARFQAKIGCLRGRNLKEFRLSVPRFEGSVFEQGKSKRRGKRKVHEFFRLQ